MTWCNVVAPLQMLCCFQRVMIKDMLSCVHDGNGSNLPGWCSEEHTGDKCCCVCVCVWWHDVQEVDIFSSFLSPVPPNNNDKRSGGLVGGIYYTMYPIIPFLLNETLLSLSLSLSLSLFLFLSFSPSKSHMLSPFISLSLPLLIKVDGTTTVPQNHQSGWSACWTSTGTYLGCDDPNTNNRLSCTSTILIVVWM